MMLILKVKASTELSDYTSISCVYATYKVISKILANIITKMLPNFISTNQMTFIKGKWTSDNIGLAQESLIRFLYHGTSRRACISIDFRKAIDTLRWDTIDVAMTKMGFNYIFRQLIRACISLASFSMLVEGSLTEGFHVKEDFAKVIQFPHFIHSCIIISKLQVA